MAFETNQQYNVFPYHQVFANATANILTLIGNKQEKEALTVAKLCFLSACALNDKNFEDSMREVKGKTIEQLVFMMMKEEKEAGITPVQFKHSNSVFAEIKRRASEGFK